MGKIVLKNGTIVNEGIVQEKDILIVDDVISKILMVYHTSLK